MSVRPETHYATSGELQIAYQAFGSGPELVWVPGWVSQLDLYWEEPALVRFLNRLASFARVIVFDRRGTARVLRAAGSPSSFRTYAEMSAAVDVRAVLPNVRVPTLVLVREDAKLPKGGIDVDGAAEARWVAERIPDATLAVVPGRDYLPWVGDRDAVLDEIASFVGGERPVREPDRVLLTILFTDLVGSTAHVAELGDLRWRELLERHNEAVRRVLARFGGREIDRAGDGFLATFDGPARAVRAALTIVAELASLELDVRAGVHTGEVELLEEGIGGIAVHIGARVAGLGTAGEVLVTRTVKDLTAGSELEFEGRGTHALRGIPGDWEVFAAKATG